MDNLFTFFLQLLKAFTFLCSYPLFYFQRQKHNIFNSLSDSDPLAFIIHSQWPLLLYCAHFDNPRYPFHFKITSYSYLPGKATYSPGVRWHIQRFRRFKSGYLWEEGVGYHAYHSTHGGVSIGFISSSKLSVIHIHSNDEIY